MAADSYDVVIVGLGAMGSAALYQLAKAGASVLGLDQYSPPHAFGSSYGDTRITRLAVGEGAEYVPLVRRSHELWRQIEQATGKTLLNECGGLVMSVDGSQGAHGVKDFVGQTVRVAQKHGIQHSVLSIEEIHNRFPQFNTANEHGYYEPESGYVRPEACIEAQLHLAYEHGATIKTNETVTDWTCKNDTVSVTTNVATYKAKKLIIAAGSWVNDFMPQFQQYFKIYRQVVYWFDIADKSKYELYRDMPVYIWVYGKKAGDYMYGFPAIDGPDGGIKIASEDYSVETTPTTLKRNISVSESAEFYQKHVKDKLPGISSKCINSNACLYTVTPEFKFVIDFHPEHPNVIIASPCSGHGFKHSAAIGEVLSQLATTGRSETDISNFSFNGLHINESARG